MDEHLISVATAARVLGVSARRIRALLAQGRIVGYRRDGFHWSVRWPLDVKPGKRGPDLLRFPVRLAYGAAKAPKAASRQLSTGTVLKIGSRASGEV